MSQLIRLIDRFTSATGRVTRWLSLFMVLATCSVVVLRYLFDMPSIALREGVMYLHASLFMHPSERRGVLCRVVLPRVVFGGVVCGGCPDCVLRVTLGPSVSTPDVGERDVSGRVIFMNRVRVVVVLVVVVVIVVAAVVMVIPMAILTPFF